MKRYSILKIQFLAGCFLMFMPELFAEEKVCKLEVLNCQGSYVQHSKLPVVNFNETTTIRVYGKFANWVTSAILIDNLTPARDKLYKIDLVLSNKHDAQTACETYIDITIPPNSFYPGRQVINMSGAPYGIGLKGTIFKFDIEAITPTFLSFPSITSAFTSTVISEITAGQPCILEVTTTKNRSDINTQDNKGFVDIDLSGNDFKIVSYVGKSSLGGDIYRYKYQVIFEAKQSSYRATSLHYTVKGNLCEKSYFTCNFLNPVVVKSIESRVDLVDDGLQGKYGAAFQECDGVQMLAASSNRRTLDSVRLQIPAPSSTDRSVTREVKWPDIRWGVKNIGASTTKTFTAQLLEGDRVLQTVTINGLASGENKIFTYSRPMSQKLLVRYFCNPDILFLVTNPPRNITELEARQKYNWTEPAKYKIRIDPNNSIQEIDETNNIIEY